MNQPATMRQIKSFGVLQTSKFVAVLYLILFAVIFGFVAVFGVFATLLSGDGSTIVGGLIGFLALFLLGPIFYAITGFIFTALTCWVYNIVATWVGGIEVELSDETSGYSG